MKTPGKVIGTFIVKPHGRARFRRRPTKITISRQKRATKESRMIRAAAFALLLLVVPAAAEPLTVSGFAFPDRVGDFTRAATHDYEKTQPGLGQGVAYTSGPWLANIYVYDMRRTSIPDDPASDVLKSQFAQAQDDIFTSLRYGRWVKATLRRTFAFPESGTPRFNCADFTLLTRENTEVYSLLCVGAAKNKFVKFRVTGPQGGGGEALRFIETLDPQLRPGA
jgi:hypothetical protein